MDPVKASEPTPLPGDAALRARAQLKILPVNHQDPSPTLMEATSLELSGSKRSSQRNDLPDSPQSPSPLPPSRPATSPESSTAASPPEDPTAGGNSFNGHGSAEHPSHSLQRLEQELEAARDEINALHQMLEDLPEIFERKFRQRKRAFLDHHEHLLADNKALRERLYRLEQDRATGERGHTRLADRLDAIGLHAARRPLLVRRSADEILGYDENGLPE